MRPARIARAGAPRPGVVFLPGCRWEDTPGTDRKLAEALGASEVVLWVDPPLPWRVAWATLGWSAVRPHGAEVSPGVFRVRTLVPGGITHRRLRPVYEVMTVFSARAWLARHAVKVRAVVLASPWRTFPASIPGVRVYYVTDDWVAGTSLMGVGTGSMRDRMRANARRADVTAAVSTVLADLVAEVGGVPEVKTLPNGCTPGSATSPRVGPRRRSAMVLGQLNERLDLAVLRAVREAGVELDIVGPRRDRDPAFTAELDALLDSPGVRWYGEVAATKLNELLATASVGLTPYADTDFNRSSFPLKTMDYLAAGLPVVSTDLPAARWLGPGLVAVGTRPSHVAELVVACVKEPFDEDAAVLRRQLVQAHSWQARARTVMAWVAERS